MIIEKIDKNLKILMLPKTLKFNKKLFDQVVSKILKSQKEPFGKVYVFFIPLAAEQFLKHFKSKDMIPKSISTDNKWIRMEF
jgi:hypothetical protein